jgi:hypothetical protein
MQMNFLLEFKLLACYRRYCGARFQGLRAGEPGSRQLAGGNHEAIFSKLFYSSRRT